MPNSNDQQHYCLRFQGSWKKPLLAAYACSFLNNTELIDKRSGLQLALSALFGPVGVASQGGSATEVEAAISKARVIFETQMTNARLMVESSSPADSNSTVSKPASPSVSPNVKVPPPAEDDVMIPMD